MSEKEKLNLLIDSEIARAIKMESVRLGITQGELIAEMWSAYKAKDHAKEETRETENIPIARVEKMQAMQARKNEEDLKTTRIAKAKEILEDWTRFDLEIIERYRDRMRALGEEKLAKELEDLAEYKRRSI